MQFFLKCNFCKALYVLTDSEIVISSKLKPIGGKGGGFIPPIEDDFCFIPIKFLCCGKVGIIGGSQAVITI